jgi:aryl-alcohol dehydrogenase-like predicted oxidoreductase
MSLTSTPIRRHKYGFSGVAWRKWLRGTDRFCHRFGLYGNVRFLRPSDRATNLAVLNHALDIGGELSVCREFGISLVAYSPLGRGFLTGKIQKREDLPAGDWRLTNPRFQEGNFDTNLRLVEAVTAIASERGCTPAQLALAWLLYQGGDIVPIPGTRSVSRLDENAGVANLQLTTAELERINSVLSSSAVAGKRYVEAGMISVQGDSPAR